ncbi:MAG: MBL fold metallo-hydrolase [Deltaproteobacteria bacterium]|nr:MBL fold metallo-hydrolase [Deltaproteobacteria bacterium]
MGTAGLYINDGETRIFIDPFVSRYGFLKVASGFSLKPNPKTIQEWIMKTSGGQADAVFVSHSHYDHSMDAPFFAEQTGAILAGGESTAFIGRGAGLPDEQIRIVRAEDQIKVGKFRITFLKSLHSPALFGRVPWPGKITSPLKPPAAASEYRLGEIFSILVEHPKGKLLHQGSAGFLPGMYNNMAVDVIFLSIAGRADTYALLKNSAIPLQAKRIIPIHFDNFFSSLNKRFSFLRGVDFQDFCNVASGLKPTIPVQTLPVGQQAVLFP